jgi:hypothetical protein
MYASVRALLHEIIDYAGLFPPAKLPLPEALNNYLRYRKESPHRWMLGRFVCPTAQLGDLLALAEAHPDGSLLSVTALGQQAPEVGDFSGRLETDLKAIEHFRSAMGANSVVDSIEVPLPKSGPADGFRDHLGHVAEHMVQAKLRGYLEIPRSPRWEDDVKGIAAVIGSLRDTWGEGVLGLKLRCGGVSADAFPGDSQVAFFIAQCGQAEIPWKATAGLHHPRRHRDDSLGTWHHGFLNVFCAGVLAWKHALDRVDIARILADRDAHEFHASADGFTWGNLRLAVQDITHGRAKFATSFGSCSFMEPCDDLIAMELLDSRG